MIDIAAGYYLELAYNFVLIGLGALAYAHLIGHHARHQEHQWQRRNDAG